MIISHSQKFIFIHIQKNAGTSITRYLDKYLTYQDVILGCTKFGEAINPFYKQKYQLHKHSYAIKVRNIAGNDVWKEYFTFSFVRNPWDRMVSLYKWCCRGKYKFTICQEAIEAGSFSNFIRSRCFQSLPEQMEYISDRKGNIIVDFIGKQESINQDFEHICKQLQIPSVDMEKFKKNVSRSYDKYQNYYNSDEDINIVKKQFARDIDFFKYSF